MLSPPKNTSAAFACAHLPPIEGMSQSSLSSFNLDHANDVADVIDPYASDGSGASVQASDSAIAGSAAQRRFINSA